MTDRKTTNLAEPLRDISNDVGYKTVRKALLRKQPVETYE